MASSDLASLVVRLQADISQFTKGLDSAAQQLSKFQQDITDKFSELAKDIAGAFTIDAIAEFSAGAIEAEAALARFSQTAGVSVETLSGLSIAAKAAGVDQSGLADAFKHLNQSISEAVGDPTSKAAVAFKLLGISAQDLKANLGNAGAVNSMVADAFSRSADGANKVAIAMALMGRNGQSMIPVLNQGSAGLDQMQASAAAAGATTSGDAAKAAEELEQKLSTLESEIKGGLQSAIADSLIPVLDRMADSMKTNTNYAQEFSGVGTVMAGGLKAIATVGHDAALGLKAGVGDALGASVAVAAQTIQGNLTAAGNIMADWMHQETEDWKTFGKSLSDIWGDNTNDAVSWATATMAELDKVSAAAKTRIQLPSLEGALKSADADKQLQRYSDSLRDQAGSFNLGAEAAARYKLQFGPLADALKIAGDAGNKAASSAIGYAKALQFKIDTKSTSDFARGLAEQVTALDQSEVAAFNYKLQTGQLGDELKRMGASGYSARIVMQQLESVLVNDKDAKAVQEVNDKLDEMAGKLETAALHAFDLQNKPLVQNLTAQGDTSGLARVAALRQQTDAQALFNQKVADGEQAQQQFGLISASLSLQQSQGLTTDLKAQQDLNTAQKTEIDQLLAIYGYEKQLADLTGNKALETQSASLYTQILGLERNLNPLTQQIRGDLENSLVDPLLDAETGTKSFKAAFTDMAKSIERDLLTIADKNIAQSIFGSGGSLGGLAPMLAGLFGEQSLSSSVASSAELGGMADSLIGSVGTVMPDLPLFAAGGTLPANSWGIAGENGPELLYSGSRSMDIVPPGQGSSGGQTIIVNAKADAPGGTITRRSSMQVANDVGAQVAIAGRRNGR